MVREPLVDAQVGHVSPRVVVAVVKVHPGRQNEGVPVDERRHVAAEQAVAAEVELLPASVEQRPVNVSVDIGTAVNEGTVIVI